MSNGLSLQQHRRNEDVLKEVDLEGVVMTMRRGLEWFGHGRRRKGR